MFAIEAYGNIIKNKILHTAPLQCPDHYLGFLFVEIVVLNHEVDIIGTGIEDEFGNAFVAGSLDHEDLVNNLLPPVAADEEQWEQEDTTPDYRIPETASIVSLDHGACDIEPEGTIFCQLLRT